MLALDREELAWAAGFFDGEGCFNKNKAGNKNGWYWPNVTVTQVDPRPLLRFWRAVGGVGIVRGPYGPYKGSVHARYEYHASDWRNAQAVMCLLWPFLSGPKREQALAVFGGLGASLAIRPRGAQRRHGWRPTHCKRGHDFSNHRMYRGKRICRDCESARDLARRR